tara:strand:- start:608 stop:1666 length:1059 start_codon:yes stop_codon:yes gene_type:complete
MHKIIYREENEEDFFSYWNDLISKVKVSPRYTKNFINYSNSLTDVSDKSFVLINDNKVAAIAFVPIENTEYGKCISIRNEFVQAPISLNKKIDMIVFKHIDQIAIENDVSKISYEIDPLISFKEINYNRLLIHNYIQTNSTNYIMNFKLSEDEFIKSLNQSIRHTITKYKSESKFEVCFFVKDNINKAVFQQYEEAHILSAGKKTRPQKSFDIQYQMIIDGEGMLCVLKYENRKIGFLFVSFYQKNICLFSIANIPEHESKVPIYKILMYEVYKLMHGKGYEYALMGSPASDFYVQGFQDYYDQKKINISKYKQGYRPHMVEHLRGVKYLKEKILLNDIKAFETQLLRNLKP